MTDNDPFLIVAIGNFNARSSSRCINDKNNYEGTKIDCLTTEYDLRQVIHKPTYLLENSSSTKFSDGCRRPSMLTCKLLSSNSLCQL